MSANPVSLFEHTTPVPQTLADLRQSIDFDLTEIIVAAARANNVSNREGDSATYWRRGGLRTAFNLLAQYFDRPLDCINISDIILLTKRDFEVNLKIKRNRAKWLLSCCNQMLQYADSYGWTSEARRRYLAWEPVRVALRTSKRGSAGCQGIVTWAWRHGWWPGTFTLKAMLDWEDSIRGEHSVRTFESEEWSFRKKLRDAGLQKLFPFFDLSSKQLTPYYLPMSEMLPELRAEIEYDIEWKLKLCPVKYRVRDVSAASTRESLQAICGYATYIRRIAGITSIRQVITREIVSAYIVWLRNTRACQWGTIKSALKLINALITQKCPPFDQQGLGEYSWLASKIQQLPNDNKNELKNRKLQRAVPHHWFAKIAHKLSLRLKHNKHLTPVDRAILLRNYFFCKMLARHPWRRRNFSGCRVSHGTHPNIEYRTIPLRIQRRKDFPKWAAKLLQANRQQEFWVVYFTEAETKAKHEVWELLDPDLIPILEEYLQVRADILIGKDKPDPGTLLVSKCGKALSPRGVCALLQNLSWQIISKRLGMHIVRTIVSEHAVAQGCKFDKIQAMLWHKRVKSTERYQSAVNSSHAMVVFEKHLDQHLPMLRQKC